MNIEGSQQYLAKFRSDLNYQLLNFSNQDKINLNARPIDILICENNNVQVEQFESALKSAGIKFNMSSVNDFSEAQKFLNREEPYRFTPIPDVVVIDMCSEQINGQKLLQFMENDPSLRGLPVMAATEKVETVNSSTPNIHSCHVSKPYVAEKVKNRLFSIKSLCPLLGMGDQLMLGNG